MVGILKKRRRINPFRSSNEADIWVLESGTGKAYISGGPMGGRLKQGETPYIEDVPGDMMSLLKEGDVVLATPDGRLNIIYDSESQHNCIFATNRCNLKCLMCPQPPSSEADTHISNQIESIRLIARHKPEHLGITGGEPTLLGTGLIELIAACKKHLNGTALTILTNGKNFKNFAYVKDIAEIRHPNLQFAIPIYSDDYSIHDRIVGIPGSFFDTVKGLHNLALFGLGIEIRTVVLPQNASRLKALAEFIYRNLTFVRHVAFMGIEVTGIARRNADILWQDPSEYVNDLVKTFQYMKRVDMPASIYNFQLCILPETLWPFCRKSISDWKNGYVDECKGCSKKNDCGGFFTTSGEYKSNNIHMI